MSGLTLSLMLPLLGCDSPTPAPFVPQTEDTGTEQVDTDTTATETEDDTTASEPADVSEPEPAPLTVERFSHVGQAILETLSDQHESSYGYAWSYHGDAHFDENWFLQTPGEFHWGEDARAFADNFDCTGGVYCDEDFALRLCSDDRDCPTGGSCQPLHASVTHPDQEPTRMCVGHSDLIYEQMYLTLRDAKTYADVATLTEPDGRFLTALRNALTYMDNAGSTAQVRVLFGHIPGLPLDTEAVLDDLTAGVSAGSDLQVHVGAYRIGIDSWNHAKIVARDGESLLTGGHNMWSVDYLQQAPVHDVSMVFDGGEAATAHRFLDEIWSYTCEDHVFEGWTERDGFPGNAPDCPPEYGGSPATDLLETGTRTITLARLGALGANPADDAILAAIGAAQTSIKLSQQDVGPIRLVGDLALSGWPLELMRELLAAMSREVDVYYVMSSPGSYPGGGSTTYSNGWTPEEIAEEFLALLDDEPALNQTTLTNRALICTHFHAAPLRFNEEELEWPDGTGIGNHSKVFFIDDVAMYVGSQNLYPADLAEHGVLIDSADVTAQALAAYWDPMWSYSVQDAVSGRHAPGCTF